MHAALVWLSESETLTWSVLAFLLLLMLAWTIFEHLCPAEGKPEELSEERTIQINTMVVSQMLRSLREAPQHSIVQHVHCGYRRCETITEALQSLFLYHNASATVGCGIGSVCLTLAVSAFAFLELDTRVVTWWLLGSLLQSIPPLLTVLIGEASPDPNRYMAWKRLEAALGCVGCGCFLAAWSSVATHGSREEVVAMIGMGLAMASVGGIATAPGMPHVGAWRLGVGVSSAGALASPSLLCIAWGSDAITAALSSTAQSKATLDQHPYGLDPRLAFGLAGIMASLLAAGLRRASFPERFIETWVTGRAYSYWVDAMAHATLLACMHLAQNTTAATAQQCQGGGAAAKRVELGQITI